MVVAHMTDNKNERVPPKTMARIRPDLADEGLAVPTKDGSYFSGMAWYPVVMLRDDDEFNLTIRVNGQDLEVMSIDFEFDG